MLRPMMKLLRRCHAAGLAATVLMTAGAADVRAQEEPAPSQTQPSPKRTTSTQVTSTEAGGTLPSEPVAPAPTLPALPTAAPPADPNAPTAAPPSEPTATDQATPSSEPPSPSEYDYAADTDPAALNDFRDALSPYGTWEEDPTYGVVWVPSSLVVGADFAPYVSHGHWGLGAGNAWMWVSDFGWGWAPFHYGRWTWIGGRGWGWIPGRVYAPAWVVWRTGFYDDYYVGWAPMPPSWYWRRGWAYRLGFAPSAPYVFCSATHVFAPHVRMHIAPASRVPLIAPRTRPYVAASPSVASPMHTTYAMTRGPSMVDAHVPTASVPVQRVAPDARAVSFARQQVPSRSFGTAQPGAVTGRTDVSGRPSTFPSAPRSNVYTTRPMPSTGASMSGPQLYTPRPMGPSAAPMQPMMPAVPRAAPVVPSMPRSYGPPSAPLVPSVPRAYSPPSAPMYRPTPAPAMRPSSPAPMVRPSAPPVVNTPRPMAPSVRSGPVVPRTSR
ncbi:MAG TPA: DUF6600 domain-containing protein [Polyangiaceae bacterium]|nr:DUF6600 domain-containing protein [Polyangiaceae bacterium]